MREIQKVKEVLEWMSLKMPPGTRKRIAPPPLSAAATKHKAAAQSKAKAKTNNARSQRQVGNGAELRRAIV
jgi:hypothetical protein